jgi:hypothetical protein
VVNVVDERYEAANAGQRTYLKMPNTVRTL